MNMSNESEKHAAEMQAAMLERLSALMDGEVERDAAAQACGHWRESVTVQTQWHAYHLIGDVMRSDDLATDPASDLAFLTAFRARLANEPVVLAPQMMDSMPSFDAARAPRVANGGRSGRWSWVGTSAIAAGFVAVAGVLVVTRPGLPGLGNNAPEQRTIASTAPLPAAERAPVTLVSGGTPSPSLATAAEPQIFVANGQFIRDARLDQYLSAHKQFAGSSALGVPSAFLRNATADAADR
jgi:sigma-E factor negative regulatory protein RseA